MDLDTRHLAAFLGKVTLRVRDILAKAQVQRFEIRQTRRCAFGIGGALTAAIRAASDRSSTAATSWASVIVMWPPFWQLRSRVWPGRT